MYSFLLLMRLVALRSIGASGNATLEPFTAISRLVAFISLFLSIVFLIAILDSKSTQFVAVIC